MALRIAMWSGPRNISTALMRSFGSRPDTAVCDEPLYAHYLAHRPVEHPCLLIVRKALLQRLARPQHGRVT
jgi:hypothetical protein